jgi:hypothetical protein
LKTQKSRDMVANKFGDFATLNDYYLCAPITQPDVDAEDYEIKQNFLNLVQQKKSLVVSIMRMKLCT